MNNAIINLIFQISQINNIQNTKKWHCCNGFLNVDKLLLFIWNIYEGMSYLDEAILSKYFCVQQDLQYGVTGSHMLNIESSKFLTML
jgi:hypothetical protein